MTILIFILVAVWLLFGFAGRYIILKSFDMEFGVSEESEDMVFNVIMILSGFLSFEFACENYLKVQKKLKRVKLNDNFVNQCHIE